MRRPSFVNRELVAFAMLAGAAGACSPAPEEDASNSTGQEEYVKQIQTELDSAALSDPNSFNSFKPVKPVLKCVDKLANNQYRAHFGYTNSSSSSVSIPVGFFNRFWPPPISRGQPTVFAPGSQADVVQVTFSGFSASIWVLGDHFSVATKFSKLCPAGGTGGAGGSGAGGSAAGGSGAGGRGMGGAAAGGSGAGGAGAGGRGMGGAAAGGSGAGGTAAGGSGAGGTAAGGSGAGGSAAGGSGAGGAAAGGSGAGGSAAGGSGAGGAGGCMVPTNCDDQNPCTIDGVDQASCVCTHIAAIDGSTCSDGNACTQVDTCQAGVCVGSSPKTCTAIDQCHIVGVCDTTTGACSNPTAPDGRTCNADNDACTVTDICVSGICTMGTPTICAQPDQCHTAGTCDKTTGACSNPSAPNGTTCNDGNACTTSDVCSSGVCGGTAVVCAPADSCHIAGVCNPASGTCSTVNAPNGTTCTDNNACTTGETCQAGLCSGGTTKTCTALDSCHVAGTCDTVSGTCSNPAAANGTSCTDNNACTTGDSCQSGTCVSGAPVVCGGTADSCHTAGTCDPTTGLCGGGTKPDGTLCDDGLACTTGDACRAGVCTPTATTPPDHCDSLACEQCTSGQQPGEPDLCDSSPDSCFNCDPSISGCDQITDPTDKALCENLYACLVAPTHPGNTAFPGSCLGNFGDPLGCWCGSNGLTCATADGAANGPCVQQVLAAAKTTTASTINNNFVLPTANDGVTPLPLGRATNLAICRGSFCVSECSVPHL